MRRGAAVYRFRRRFLLAGIAILVLAMLVVFALGFALLNRQLTEKNEMLHRNLLEHAVQNLEDILKSADRELYRVSTQPKLLQSLKNSVYTYNWESFENINLLKAEISALKQLVDRSGDLGATVALIHYGSGWTLDDASFNDETFPSSQHYKRMAQLALAQDQYGATIYGSKLLFCDGALYLVRSIGEFGTDPMGALMIYFPIDTLEQAVSNIADRESFLIFDPDRTLVFSYCSEQTVWTRPQLDALLDEPAGIQRIDGMRYAVLKMDSLYAPWQYVSCISDSFIWEQVAHSFARMLGITLALMLGFVACYLMICRKLYRPAAQLLDQLIERSELTAYPQDDEVAILSRYLESMQDSRLFLMKVAQENRAAMTDMLFDRLLVSYGPDNALSEMASRLSVDFSARACAMTVLRVEGYTKSEFSSENSDLSLFAIKNIADELFPAPFRFFSGIHDRAVYLILDLSDAHGQLPLAQIRPKLSNLLRVASLSMGMRLGCGVSGPFEFPWQTAAARRQAQTAIQTRNASDGPICVYAPAQRETKQFALPEKALERLIIACAPAAERQQAEALLGEYFLALLQENAGENAWQYGVCQLLCELSKRLLDAGLPLPAQPLAQLLAMDATACRKALMEGYIVPLIENVRKEAQPLLSDQVIAIIREQYAAPLSLEYCADQLGYHPSTVSRAFREQVGYSFKEYLYLYRIERAQELLVTTDLKIQEISAHLCYSNTQNFTRIFKRVVGMTPGAYRIEAQQHGRSETPRHV